MKKKKILAVTGIRSEYDILYPVLRAMESSANFELSLVVTGAHLSDWHGNTFSRIIDDGFNIVDKIDYLLMTNRRTQRAKGVGVLVQGLTQTVERVQPDIILFVGDREESIACSIVGNYMDVLVAHIAGGDSVFGNSDDPVRFACSKLAHIHFTFAEEYSENLKSVGEECFRVFCSGNPALNNIKETAKVSDSEISSFLNFEIRNKKYIVFLKHPLSSELEDSYTQMKTSLMAVQEFSKKTGYRVVGIYPNTDPGSYDIIKAIDEFRCENIQFYKTLPKKVFINLMRGAKCLIGNSSMGLLEAPFYKLPVINVGNRQLGRLNAGNVEYVDYDVNKILVALDKACFNDEYRLSVEKVSHKFGDGNSHFKILKFLEEIDLTDRKWYVKRKLC